MKTRSILALMTKMERGSQFQTDDGQAALGVKTSGGLGPQSPKQRAGSLHLHEPAEIIIRHAAIRIGREFRFQVLQEIHVDGTKELHVDAAA